MILAIDVGNTNITFGVFAGKRLMTTFRMMAKTPRTSDEYGIGIRELLRENRVDPSKINGSIIA